jgi:hypothetical protein
MENNDKSGFLGYIGLFGGGRGVSMREKLDFGGWRVAGEGGNSTEKWIFLGLTHFLLDSERLVCYFRWWPSPKDIECAWFYFGRTVFRQWRERRSAGTETQCSFRFLPLTGTHWL